MDGCRLRAWITFVIMPAVSRHVALPLSEKTKPSSAIFAQVFCWFPRWPCNLTSLDKCSTIARVARASVQNTQYNPVTPAATTSVRCWVIFIRKICICSLWDTSEGGCLSSEIHVLTPWVIHTLEPCVWVCILAGILLVLLVCLCFLTSPAFTSRCVNKRAWWIARCPRSKLGKH